jgi:acyl-coenzyme A thioesterase PaaI-like protein
MTGMRPIPLAHLSQRARLLWRFVNWWPPFLGAGIRVQSISPDGLTITARLALNFLNRNLVGTQFGGALYGLCDPWFMIILMQQLGPDYVVWDKSAGIQFLRPGRGPVSAVFRVTPEQVAAIRAAADRGEKVEPAFSVEVVDDAGRAVARVDKLLYVRRKSLTPKE